MRLAAAPVSAFADKKFERFTFVTDSQNVVESDVLELLPTVKNIPQGDAKRITTLYTREVRPYSGKTRKLSVGDVVSISNASTSRHTQQPDVRKPLRLPRALVEYKKPNHVGVVVEVDVKGIVLATRIQGKLRRQKWTKEELETRAGEGDIYVHGNLDVTTLDNLFNELGAIATSRATDDATKDFRPHQYIVRLKIGQT